MPFTPEMRRKVDQIRDYLFGGGYPDPVGNAEQLSFLFFFCLMEGLDRDNLLVARASKREYRSIFEGIWTLRNPLSWPRSNVVFDPARIELGGGMHIASRSERSPTIPRERLRWSVWARGLAGEALVRFVRDEVFPFFAEVAKASAVDFMEGARLAIDEPTVLVQVVSLVDDLGLEQADADTKGDLFEHVLKQIKQAGELGQFRTPRHVIRAMVEMVNPVIGETVYDPAAGTAGFLVAAYNHIRLANSSPAAVVEVELDGKRQRRGHGDRLSQTQFSRLQNHTFFGNDVDPKMVRLATMNLTLRGLPNVRILKRNVLTSTLDPVARDALGLPPAGYDVVLANPPFSGRLDKDRIVDDVRVGTTSATEILFLKYMLESLKPGGQCGVVVPEGVLFGSTGAHRELRRQLLENNTVEAVLSLPGGVFQPYSGVKTSVLLFRKGGQTERVLFLHADADGYKLDANHDQPLEEDDLPGLVAAFRDREALWSRWQERDGTQPWTEKWWFADGAAIRSNEFNLSASRYRPVSMGRVEHRDPREILDELAAIEAEIVQEVEALRLALTNGVAGESS